MNAAAATAVDDYLHSQFNTRLEDVLCDGCLIGRPDIRLAATVKVLPRLMRTEKEDDGGEFASYEGTLIIDDIWYRFGCHIIVDGNGSCFMADISAFDAVEWKLRIAV
jgi:hypothetical protein